MKSILVLSVLCACALAAPSPPAAVSLIESPAVVPLASPVLLHASPAIAQPLLAQVPGEAPASTVHAKHVTQVLVPQVKHVVVPHPQIISYSLPAASPAQVILHSPLVSAQTRLNYVFRLASCIFLLSARSRMQPTKSSTEPAPRRKLSRNHTTAKQNSRENV
jgi:hypothetical protein